MFARKPGLIVFILVMVATGCKKDRDDIVFEAFTEPAMDYYSLKLYANREFDFHVPVIDYFGRYILSGDTLLLKSIEHQPRRMSVTVNGRVMTKTITEMEWKFLIDKEKGKIRPIGSSDSTGMVIDIVLNKLSH